MQIKPNRKRVSRDTDKHICKFLLSSFTSFKSYKAHFGLSFPDPKKAISNRVDYLKNLQKINSSKFIEIIQSYGINSIDLTSDYSSDYSTESEDEDYNTPVAAPRKSHTSISKQSPPKEAKRTEARTTTSNKRTTMPSQTNALQMIMRKHQHCLNFDNPSLNNHGMMWFRDDDVEIGEDLVSVLTIYQPLFDGRDQDLIKIEVDSNDPTILHHTLPTVPTFMYRNYKLMHEQDFSYENPEVFSATKKKHMKHASKIAKNDCLKLQTSEYELPFSLSLTPFDGFEHSGSQIEMRYRQVVVHYDIDLEITDTMNYVFWKVMIEGETTNCSAEVLEKKRNKFAEAQNRMFIQLENNSKMKV